MSDLLEVAKLGRTVGLKGALKLHNLSDFEAQFKKGAKFITKSSTLKNSAELVIKSYEPSKSLVIFEGFESIELANTLVNSVLLRSIEDTRKFCKLGKDEYFYFDIIGSKICENSRILGLVKDICEVGAGFLFCVETDEQILANEPKLPKEFFIPYNDHFVLSVDIKAKEIITQNSYAILENS